jgi:HK97 family phage prohead protease
MTTDLVMEVRDVDEETRIVTGVAVPYDETSYLVPNPSGERIARGAFAKSIRQRETKIPLLVGHGHSGAAVGLSTRWADDDAGLLGAFRIKTGHVGDEALEDVRTGHLPAMSVGFKPLAMGRHSDGSAIVKEGRLLEVSLCAVGAYEGAQVVSVRNAQHVAALLEPFANPPAVDLSPFVLPWQR